MQKFIPDLDNCLLSVFPTRNMEQKMLDVAMSKRLGSSSAKPKLPRLSVPEEYNFLKYSILYLTYSAGK
jgi:hypothetical protein